MSLAFILIILFVPLILILLKNGQKPNKAWLKSFLSQLKEQLKYTLLLYIAQVLLLLFEASVLNISDNLTFLSISTHLKMFIIAWSLAFFVLDMVVPASKKPKDESTLL